MSSTVVTSAPETTSAAPAQRSSFFLPVWSLSIREIVRFFRQRTRIIGALGQPVIFWILFGAGLHGSFQPPEWAPAEMTYQEYFFPGIAVMILLFTSIFSTISIIEDRREGFLQGVLVAPIPRSAIVFGKIWGGTVIAVVQAILFLLIGPALHFLGLAPTMTINVGVLNILGLVAFLTLLGFTLTALGYMIAWPMNSTQGFHAIMSVFLFPMWLLSGAFFPGGDSGWMAWIIRLNPLTYGVAGVRHLLAGPGRLKPEAGLPGLWMSIGVTVLFCAVCLILSIRMTRRQVTHDSR